MILFGLLVDRAGLVPALTVLVFGSATGGSQFRWGEVLLLTAGLTLLSVVLFVWALRLSYPLFTLF
jgi:hypothetical protein